MGAYNYVDFVAKCPSCGEMSMISVQTNIASSYSGQVGIGQFHGAHYGLDAKMNWFEPSDSSYPNWRCGRIDKSDLEPDEDEGMCFGDCSECSEELIAIIRFKDLRPVEVVYLGAKKDGLPEDIRGYTGMYS